MNQRLKSFIVNLPIIGKLYIVIGNVIKLPDLNDRFNEHLNTNETKSNNIESEIKKIYKTIDQINGQFNELTENLSSLRLAQDNIAATIEILEKHNSKEIKVVSDKAKGLFADDHIMDIFYTNFEDEFRGDEKDIKNRQKVYLEYFNKSGLNFKNNPVLDIGSGRGEFISLLKDNHIRAKGLDINIDMVERSISKGLDAVQDDALPFLQKTKPQTYGAITGFHIVEHIPFNDLLRIFKAAHKTLMVGGFVIFETPNPENIIVASSGFYTDPSHLNPIPPDLLAFALKSCNFRNVEIKRLHPVDVQPSEIKGLPQEIINRFYGSRDYAVIGYK